jgi:hypothetical protein
MLDQTKPDMPGEKRKQQKTRTKRNVLQVTEEKRATRIMIAHTRLPTGVQVLKKLDGACMLKGRVSLFLCVIVTNLLVSNLKSMDTR